MNIALILSGGIGSRVREDIPKQYIEIAGKPVISYCLETFENCKSIDALQIVADKEWHALIQGNNLSKLKGFSGPGETRQLSVLNGLEDIRAYADEGDIVIIHDAARPLVTEKILEEIIDASRIHDGAMPVLPMKDTVYYSESGTTVSSLLDRKRIYAGQAPEAFVLGKYYEANKELAPEDMLKINGSTEPAILAGLDIALVPGDEKNLKITTGEDLEWFRKMVVQEKE